MRFAIIGVGSVGSTLAGAIKGAGHDVVLAATTPEKAEAAARSLGVEARRAPSEAVESAEAVVLAVPFSAARELAEQLAGVLDGKIVIDVTNPVSSRETTPPLSE
jgi:predicted dinucleotide-binding enzyme